MGYTTEFTGSFRLNKRLDPDTHQFLKKFNETRRMKRDVTKLSANRATTFGGSMARSALYGVEGEFYVDGEGVCGQDHDQSVIDYNRPPSTQPGLWCQWKPSDDGLRIEWDGGEKFYEYEDWLKYLIAKILAPKGYSLAGSVEFQGEDSDDHGWLNTNNGSVWITHEQPGVDLLQSPAPPPEENLGGAYQSEENPQQEQPANPPRTRKKKAKPATIEATPKRACNWID